MKYNATYTSVWDDGIRVSARCCANRRTKTISRIGKNDICETLEEQLGVLENEEVTFDDTGETFRAMSVSDAIDIYGVNYTRKEIESYYGETYLYDN